MRHPVMVTPWQLGRVKDGTGSILVARPYAERSSVRKGQEIRINTAGTSIVGVVRGMSRYRTVDALMKAEKASSLYQICLEARNIDEVRQTLLGKFPEERLRKSRGILILEIGPK